MGAAYLNEHGAQEATGAIQAQRIVDALRDGRVSPEQAWMRFVELASEHGWKSAACRAYLLELSKRATV
ncbi:hypothetical protein [Piscinibacter defluvii]|uniref:hypothetical protein n=1 Tax=Piscinibacter defluvii TaxID=1796922 RepID=UPI000FDF07B7|nr:hypothetical protein [Piscinibacter defluvii]